jgi:choline dehydrogenase-like flavoprotein
MIEDFATFKNDSVVETDLCVIGAGAAGITIAREFIGSKLQVCVVESGGLDLDPRTQSLYEGESVGLPLQLMEKQRVQGMDAGRLRFFGGTTNSWGGICAPLDVGDLRVRPWVPYSGWPLAREELDAWYERAFLVCGVDKNFYGRRLCQTLGDKIFPVAKSKLKVHAWQFAWILRFGEAYRDELRNAKNILVLLHANVTNIQVNHFGSLVKHVEICTVTGKKGLIKAKAFILACGGIENARLLLLSNQIHSKGLGNQHDLVGRFFMEHPRCCCGVLAIIDSNAFHKGFDYHWFEGSQRLRLGMALDYETQHKFAVANCVTYMQRYPPEWPRPMGALEDQLRLSTGPAEFVYLLADVEQTPNPDSRVMLSQERDRLGLHKACVDWKLTELERRTVEVAVRTVGAELERLNLATVKLDNWLLDGGKNWALNLHDIFHHMGTTRMSDDPAKGVVNRDCRVHGIANLYIAGSSVFPTSGHANPTLTVVALALRLATHLKNFEKF